VKNCKAGQTNGLNSFASGRNRELSRQNSRIARGFVWEFSGPVSATDLVQSSKDMASLLVCTRRKCLCLWVANFLWVMS